MVEQTVAKQDPDPKALACYGLLVRWAALAGGWHEEAWLRFVDGRPVSTVTTQYLAWCCTELQAAGKEALLLIWDNAPWHVSREVRTWIRRHNRKVKLAGSGVRIVACFLPIKSPWLNSIEPKWVHGKRRVVEPWLSMAEASTVPEVRSLAAGVRRDQPAVQAALDYAWSSGRVEGLITKIKLVKRQMFGRGSLDLLKHRVMAAS